MVLYNHACFSVHFHQDFLQGGDMHEALETHKYIAKGYLIWKEAYQLGLLYNSRALIYKETGYYREAFKEFRQAQRYANISNDLETYMKGWIGLGWVKILGGEKEEGKIYLESAIASGYLPENNPFIQFAVSLLHKEQ